MTEVQEPLTEPREEIPSPPAGALRVIPLGGVGEFGMNMMALQWGEDLIVIDCGIQFPEHELLGVDLVAPNPEYLADRAGRVHGIVLTHGHEDHLGGLPYVLPRINAPVYGTDLTLGLLRAKLEEFGLDETSILNRIEPRDRVAVGPFEVEFISVTHSIPEAVCLAIHTPVGIVIHTGDYRIDTSPVAGEGFDSYSLARCGEQGVVLLMADSTNVEREGSTGSEIQVRSTFERIMRESPRQVVMAMFSTAIYRMQVAIDAARKTGRKVFIIGYSIERNAEIASELGCLRGTEGLVYDERDLNQIPPEKRLILTSGSQGEPLSALSRMALGNHRRVTLEKDDTVVLSARIIPGNERAVYRMINHFFRIGARILYERNAHVHVSGHAYQDEMRAMLSLTRPKFLMPIHGELYQLMAHRELAIEEGMEPEDIYVVEDGQTLEIDGKVAELGPKVEAGRLLVDGNSVGEIGEVVLRDRRHLGADGMVTVILVIDQSNGKILAGPDIVSRGFVYMDESEELIQQCKDVVMETYEELDDASREEKEIVQDNVRRALRRFLKQETRRFPVILPVVMEV